MRIPVGLALVCVASLLQAQPAPEVATGFTPRPSLVARHYIIVAAHPLAAEAGERILARGGTAIDAAIAAQMVLGVVEPQSSGLGGGGFLLHYSARDRGIAAYDGRETAPAAAKADLLLDDHGKPLPYFDAVASGRGIGVPGLLAMLDLAHKRYGRLPWRDLFAPAIALAEDGFTISPRLAMLIARDKLLPTNAAARAYFFHADGSPKTAGERLRNPELAATLRLIAENGPAALYRGAIARDIVARVNAAPHPGAMVQADLASYRAIEREPVCGHYRVWRVCGMPPPSSGGITVLQILGLLERFPMREYGPGSVMGAHLFSEAGRLAYADRDRYLADPAFVAIPERGLVDPAYLRTRSGMISTGRSLGRALPGDPPGADRDAYADDYPHNRPATTHLSVVDADGNAVALTSSVESAFGSRRLVRGFLLNNQLTDFSPVAAIAGHPVANRVEGGKRPRSSMSPTLVFDRDGRLVLVLGSAGGHWIINHVAHVLVAMLDGHLAADAAVSLPHVGSLNGPTGLERGTVAESLRAPLEALGHEVKVIDITSGLAVIERVADGWRGAADPRREGEARGR